MPPHSDWVVEHARVHILQIFKTMSNRRKQAHAAYLASLPHYHVYMQYSGRPPLHPADLAHLQSAIADAHAKLKQGIDADWRAAVVRYPEVLDYFYGLVDWRTPSERASSVVDPPFAENGGWPGGSAASTFGGSDKERRKKRHSRDSQRDHGHPPVSMDHRPMPQRRMSTGGYQVSSRPKAPPMAPMPPMGGQHPGYGSKGGYYGY
jgi:hypothetical protein